MLLIQISPETDVEINTCPKQYILIYFRKYAILISVQEISQFVLTKKMITRNLILQSNPYTKTHTTKAGKNIFRI